MALPWNILNACAYYGRAKVAPYGYSLCFEYGNVDSIGAI